MKTPLAMKTHKDKEDQRHIVLFDVDGTLVDGSADGDSAGLRSMLAAARMVTGRSDVYDQVEFAGRTDLQIARDLLRAAGVQDVSGRQIDALLAAYLAQLERNVETFPYRALGDIPAAVAVLREQGALIGLGTGNLRAGCGLKLASAGLMAHFNLDRGGFGLDGETRVEVLRAGVRRCDPTGGRPVIVVGDTPHDVTAAHGIGAPCVAVTTGPYDRAALQRAGAESVLDRLDETLGAVVDRLVPRG